MVIKEEIKEIYSEEDSYYYNEYLKFNKEELAHRLIYNYNEFKKLNRRYKVFIFIILISCIVFVIYSLYISSIYINIASDATFLCGNSINASNLLNIR